MHIKVKMILGSVTALTILAALPIDEGLAHTRSVVAGGFPGAYGFRPGEWQFITTTTGPLLGTSRATSMRCSHTPYQPQDTANATLSVPGSGSHGTVHCTTSHPSPHATLRNCKAVSIGRENGAKTTEVLTTHSLYTGKGKHFQMQGHGSIVYNGKLSEAYTKHGKWLSGDCLAHQPAPTEQVLKPSKQMQALQALSAKAMAAMAQVKQSLPAGALK